MSRESDWHVFDKACDITAMAARGSAATATPAQVADIFRAVFGALQEAATAMIAPGPRQASSAAVLERSRIDTMPTSARSSDGDMTEPLGQHARAFLSDAFGSRVTGSRLIHSPTM